MQLKDVVKRVQSKLDDPDGTTYDSDYIMGFVGDALEWLYNAMKRSNGQFDEGIEILPAFPAGTRDLDVFQQPGGKLDGLIIPRMIRWKLPGQDSVMFRRAEGPLEFVRDMPDPGVVFLDSWAWQKYSIKLSKTSIDLDLEVTGDFLFPPLTDPEAEIRIAKNGNRALACKVASDIGKARGRDKWKLDYAIDADEAVDDINSLLVKAMQGFTNRVGRMSRKFGRGSRITN